MLFNSYEFILLFFPVVFATFHSLTRHKRYRPAMLWLVAASLFFYSWQNPAYLLLLLASITANFATSHMLVYRDSARWRQCWLILGIIGNLLPLAFYKYADFILQNLQTIGLLQERERTSPALPLAISFFTFQQIAFLTDTYRTGKAQKNFLEYTFCVSFFPHLIAGPLIYYREFIEQLTKGRQHLLVPDNIIRGFILFILGLSKKVLIGDMLGNIIQPAFDSSAGPTGAFDAWAGSILFGFQIYFDFSAYSDMAIGLAYMMGLKLPVNFDSPYQSITYREFWRRWHVTLFRFFRDHVYRPLQGHEPSPARRFALTFLVFFLSGLWHGAAWTFIAWGLANWALVVLNDLWLMLPGIRHTLQHVPSIIRIFIGRSFVFICMSWTFMLFRSPDFSRAWDFLRLAFSAAHTQDSSIASFIETTTTFAFIHELTSLSAITLICTGIILLLALVWGFPNAVRLTLSHDDYYHEEQRSFKFSYTMPWCIFIAILLWASLLGLPSATKFIYFQF